jgi:superfamily I DNA/RNA helicase
MEQLTLQNLWQHFSFTPNEGQRQAIEHTEGPLLLSAGPGSGKTRVLLWRTVNLIVFHKVPPGEIFLATFTEKAARQLKEGIQHLLGHVTNVTGQTFDLSEMAIGTVHAICQQLLTDRRFTDGGDRRVVPRLMDSLGQYFHLSRQVWTDLMETGGFERSEEYSSFHAGHQFINGYLDPKENPPGSRHFAVENTKRVFNRFSEEMLAGRELIDPAPEDERMVELYHHYRNGLKEEFSGKTDFALLQSDVLGILRSRPQSGHVFRHVIVDEYQDTNAVQETLYFLLAAGHRNICVVGDDDQALYRFRGATVENLVEFADRCETNLGQRPTRVNLQINYRSRKPIVDCYTRFMVNTDWTKTGGGHFRVMDKGIRAHSTDEHTSVVTTGRDASAEETCAAIATSVKAMKEDGSIQDYNQVACLFPSLKYQGVPNKAVVKLRNAFNAEGIPVYAPRAGRFLEVDEARAVIGLFLKVFNMPPRLEIESRSYINFTAWLTGCRQLAEAMLVQAPELADFIKVKRSEWKQRRDDFSTLKDYFAKEGAELEDEFFPSYLRRGNAKSFDELGTTLIEVVNSILGLMPEEKELAFEAKNESLSDLVEWAESNKELAAKFLPSFERQSKNLFFDLNFGGGKLKIADMKMLKEEGVVDLLRKIKKSELSADQIESLIDVVTPDTLATVMSQAKEIREEANHKKAMLKIGGKAEQAILLALRQFIPEATVSSPTGGRGSFDIRVSNPRNNKSYDLEIKSYATGKGKHFLFAPSQARRALERERNFAICLLQRPPSNDLIDGEYIQNHLMTCRVQTDVFKQGYDDYKQHKVIKDREGTLSKLAITMLEDPRVRVEGNHLKMSATDFSTLINDIRIELQ